MGRENILPTDEQTARELVLSRPQFEIIDDLLHHVESPTVDQTEKLFEDTQSGLFGEHLCSDSQLTKNFCWLTMQADIVKWCRVCQVCATRQVPVSGTFD